MSYINLSAQNKHDRNATINTDIGTAGYLMIYSGARPASPDIGTSTGNLLVALPCSNPFGTLAWTVQSVTLVSGGGGASSNGSGVVTGTTGTGTFFTANVSVSGGVVTAVNSLVVSGSYTVLPTNLNSEPVAGTGGLTFATPPVVSLAMTSVLTAGTITQTNATASGTAAWARLAINNTAGGPGIVDMDIGTTNASVIINTTTIASGGPVVVNSCTITEA